jgi:hypothetical protein
LTGEAAARDIVQFVEYNNYKNSSFDKLAEEVLKEIPGQMLSYARLNSIVP